MIIYSDSISFFIASYFMNFRSAFNRRWRSRRSPRKYHCRCMALETTQYSDTHIHMHQSLWGLCFSGTCIKCAAQCKTCSGAGSHCETCDTSAHLVDVPASGTQPAGKTCVCPDGFFSSGHTNPLTCTKCDAACKTCHGAGADQCTTCAAANSAISTKSDGTHACVCKSDHYAKSTNPLVCEDLICDKTCADCNAPGPKGCTKCPKGANLHEGSCTEFKCHAGCKDCTGPDANACTACDANFELTSSAGGKTCSCAKGYIASKTKPGTCDKIKCAEPSCKSCVSDSPNTCFECQRNTNLKETGACECEYPNIEWSLDPYVCSDTYVDYAENASDE